jgi:predicted nucleotidyltransferase component of viral defense system
MLPNYPTSISEIPLWQKAHHSTATEARLRFIQFALLTSLAATVSLSSRLVFKGGNALRFIHGNDRSTIDLDFSAEADFPDNPSQIQSMIDDAAARTKQIYQLKARCQSIHRLPPGLDKTMPTYRIKVCYQLPGDRYYQNFEERVRNGIHFSEVVELEISLNDVFCETTNERLAPSSHPVRVCTLEDILAEKLRALLQQIPRNRSRPQDVFDIASMVRRFGTSLNLDKISSFLVEKSAARDIIATKAAFNDEVKARAQSNYESEIKPFTSEYIYFEDAWEDVLRLVEALSIAESQSHLVK